MFKWIGRYFAVDNSVNENTVIGTFLLIASVVSAFVQQDHVIFGEFLVGGLACFGLSIKKKL